MKYVLHLTSFEIDFIAKNNREITECISNRKVKLFM